MQIVAICMKCQLLFSENNKKAISICRLLKILSRALSVLYASFIMNALCLQRNNYASPSLSPSYDLCEQRRPRSDCACAQSDLSLRRLLKEGVDSRSPLAKNACLVGLQKHKVKSNTPESHKSDFDQKLSRVTRVENKCVCFVFLQFALLHSWHE